MKVQNIIKSSLISICVFFVVGLVLWTSHKEKQYNLFKQAIFEEGIVKKVYDGDTITMADGKRIRIWGIDAPELNQQPPDGIISRDSLKFIVGGNVKLEIYGKDLYNRYLAKVLMGGIEMDIGLWMVKQGYAWVYKTNRNPEYLEAEKYAKGKSLGIWLQPDRIPPWEFRKK